MADLWKEAGALDVGRVLRNGEYWRCITALTLHADAQHFFGNLLFGGLLLGLTARRMGLGLALLLTVSAGTLGNALNVLYRPPDHVSLGFSTAVFGLAGILGADAALREGLGHGGWRRHSCPPGRLWLCWLCWARRVNAQTMPHMFSVSFPGYFWG